MINIIGKNNNLSYKLNCWLSRYTDMSLAEIVERVRLSTTDYAMCALRR